MTLLKHVMALAFLPLMFADLAVAQDAPPPGFAALHDALRLRPDQEQSWQIFQRASAIDPEDSARHREAYEKMPGLQAPQRMDLEIQLMRSDVEQLERRGDALKAFYATLSPDQREAFDRETLRPPQ